MVFLEFIKGADISMFFELEKSGACYYDKNEKQDMISILKNYGFNLIRLRIWDNPFDDDGNSYGGGANDYLKTVEMAKKAKEAGMKFLLDIHYSDFWTDPSKQIKPKKWTSLSYEELKEEVYNYTYSLVSKLKEEDLLPEMIQIGNEITKGFLWPEGSIENVKQMCELLEKGIQAVKDINKDIKILLHLDFGGDNELYRNWFDEVMKYNLDFDTIGLSYYPYWHWSLEKLKFNLNDISKRYDKEVIILETAYGFTKEIIEGGNLIFSDELEAQGGYPATPKGQGDFLQDLMKVIDEVPNNKGLGFVYWEPCWTPTVNSTWASEAGRKYIVDEAVGGNTWANQALFDYDGNALPALQIINDFNRGGY